MYGAVTPLISALTLPNCPRFLAFRTYRNLSSIIQNSRATSGVPSSEQSSPMVTLKSRKVWLRTDSRHCLNIAAQLCVGTNTSTIGMIT
jgi:hypothetical protein